MEYNAKEVSASISFGEKDSILGVSRNCSMVNRDYHFTKNG